MFRLKSFWAAIPLLLCLSEVPPALAEPTDADQYATEQAIDEIVVTGSRIQRDDFNSASPVTVVSGQSILDQGLSNVGEALREQPAVTNDSLNQSAILGGGGMTTVALHNLGPRRVLILINGRRVAPFTDALANLGTDLTFIPAAMVDRVEILRDGASAVYGSDAISGVVNVILKKDFDGVEVALHTGTSSEGDGNYTGASLTLGTIFERGNLLFGAEYREQDAIKQVDRDWAFPSISSLSATSFQHGTFFSPGGVFFGFNGAYFCTRAKAFGGDEVTDLSALPFSDGGCEANSVRGTDVSERRDIRRYDYGYMQDLVIDSRHLSATGYGNYELVDWVNAFVEFQFANRQSTTHLDANPSSFGTPTIPEGSIVPATNPNNPTGQDGWFLFRPTSTIGPRTGYNDSDTLRVVAGLDGTLPLGEQRWSYEASYLYTRVSADAVMDSTWNLARFNRISDPAQCAADALCAATVNSSGALDSLRPGNWTEAEIEYLRHMATSLSEFETQGWFASLTGPLFDLPAGEVSAAIGIESREEKGINKPDPVTESGESIKNQVFATDGSFDVDELFAEIDVPLLADAALADELTLNAQYRISDYSNFGSNDVYRFGLNWQVKPWIRFRANLGTAYRAPTVVDLYGGGTSGWGVISDPCDSVTAAPQPGSNAYENCLLHGLDPTTFVQTEFGIPILYGSNPELRPEYADTSSWGIVVTPGGFLDGLRLAADRWQAELRETMDWMPSAFYLQACYNGPVGLTAPECDSFDGRHPLTGAPVNFVNPITNLDESDKTNGLDLSVDYVFNADTAVWRFALAGSYVDEWTFYELFGYAVGTENWGNCIPRLTANLSVSVDWQDWNFAWHTRYVSAMDSQQFDGNNPFEYSGPPSYDKHDLRISYSWEHYRLLLGINNVTDEDPPYVFSSGNNTDASLYDVYGQYWFVRLNAHF